jgi:hypothetical protein
MGVLWKGGSHDQEILHFGDDNAYISLTPSNENGVAELIVTDGKTTEKLTAASSLATGEWSKVTVRIINGKGSLLINGKQADSKSVALDMQSVMSASADDRAVVGKGFKGAVDYFHISSSAVDEPAVSYSGIEEPDDYRLRGDVNADKEFNVADLVAMQSWLLAKPDAQLADWQAGDLCIDSSIDVFDMVMMRQLLLS